MDGRLEGVVCAWVAAPGTDEREHGARKRRCRCLRPSGSQHACGASGGLAPASAVEVGARPERDEVLTPGTEIALVAVVDPTLEVGLQRRKIAASDGREHEEGEGACRKLLEFRVDRGFQRVLELGGACGVAVQRLDRADVDERVAGSVVVTGLVRELDRASPPRDCLLSVLAVHRNLREIRVCDSELTTWRQCLEQRDGRLTRDECVLVAAEVPVETRMQPQRARLFPDSSGGAMAGERLAARVERLREVSREIRLPRLAVEKVSLGGRLVDEARCTCVKRSSLTMRSH